MYIHVLNFDLVVDVIKKKIYILYINVKLKVISSRDLHGCYCNSINIIKLKLQNVKNISFSGDCVGAD